MSKRARLICWICCGLAVAIAAAYLSMLLYAAMGGDFLDPDDDSGLIVLASLILLSFTPIVPIVALITNRPRAYLAGALTMVFPAGFFALSTFALVDVLWRVDTYVFLAALPLVLALVIGYLQLQAFRN